METLELIQGIIPPTETRELTTYSMWQAFGLCPRYFQNGYEKLLTPRVAAPALSLGKLFASWMNAYQKKEPFSPDLLSLEPREKALYLTMTRAYLEKWSGEEIEYLYSELPFWGPIVNPETDSESRSFILGGRVDGVARKPDGTLWLKETKTASNFGREYLDRLWSDFQITIYRKYLREMGIPVVGIIYDVVEKCAYRQKQGEEFQTFLERVDAWYRSGDRCHREELYLHPDQETLVFSDLWDKTQRLLAMRRSGKFFFNTNACFHWNSPCKFFELCRSNDNQAVLEGMFTVRARRHPELEGSE